MEEQNAARYSAWLALHLNFNFQQTFRHQPLVAHRSPPHKFLGVAICLILRSCGCGVVGRGRLCAKIGKFLYPLCIVISGRLR